MSIVYQYENSTIQYGDNYGNINHQGILSSNIAGSTILSTTFPTTSTGDSLGHYHYSEPTTNALQFLNVAGTGTGGHKFYSSNSTLAPVNTATIGLDGLTIDKSTAGAPILINLPNITTSGPNFVIFATTINVPPWNIGGIGNPVQVTSNTANMVTGVTYYLTGLSPQSGRITTNPDDTGIIDTSDLSSLTQPILAWVNGTGPGVTQTINLNNTLQITTGTSTSKLTSTDLLFNNVSLKTQVSTNTSAIATINSNIGSLDNLIITQKTTTNQYISAAITADGRPPTAPTTTITQQYAFTPAWYFKNTTAGYKINWYIGGDIGMTVSQVLGLYMNIFNPSMTSNNFPFLIVYTVNDTPNPPNFYKSKRTYLFNQSVTPVANTRYLMFQDVSGTCPTPFHYGSVLSNMQLSTVSGNQVGIFGPNEVILAFAINTNSNSAVNSIEFAINKFGIMTPYGTQEVSFIPIT